MLRDAAAEARKLGAKVRDAWVYHFHRNQWEFHYKGFYWNGSADNAWHAKAQGWEAWVAQQERKVA